MSDYSHGVTQNFQLEVRNLIDVRIPVLQVNFYHNCYSHVFYDFRAVKQLLSRLAQFFYHTQKVTHLKSYFMIRNDLKPPIQTGLLVLSLVSDNFGKVTVVNGESEQVVFRGGLVFELEQKVGRVSQFILDVCVIVDFLVGDFVDDSHVGSW